MGSVDVMATLTLNGQSLILTARQESDSRGPYHWVSELAPASAQRILSYSTGVDTV